MKCKTLINLTVLGILTSVPSIIFAKGKKDSLILNRIYEYAQFHMPFTDSVQDNVYVKFRFDVDRRNPTLWLIPSMYVLAKDERQYIRETYNRLAYRNEHEYDVISQVKSGTIRHNRKAMPTLLDMITPKIYDVALYNGYMLSPFNQVNRRYYKYKQNTYKDGTTRIDFRPRLYNTQLVNGYAVIETETGRILRSVLNGEYDMISFRTEIQYSGKGGRFIIPWRCSTAATFNFVGNRITTVFSSYNNCNATLSDTLGTVNSRAAMDTLRPVPLTLEEEEIYERQELREEKAQQAIQPEDTLPKKQNLLKKIFWDSVGETLVTPIRAESDQVYFKLTPIIDPLAVRYSHSKGFSYKMKLRSQYTFSPHRYLTLNPYFGYNFKIKQFFFNAPLRMTYNPKRNGYAEVVFANGNRISNSTVEAAIKQQYGDSLDFSNQDANKFNNTYLRVFNNIMLFDWIDIETGVVYHRRGAVNKDLMEKYQMPTEYRSFAPMFGVKLRPWENGPLFSIDWERGITGVMGSNIDYERWEIDGQLKHKMPGLRLLNLRLGYGVYTRRAQNYFVDFDNFQDTNLPEGWDDDWSGDFHELDGEEFNNSNYYIRANSSYDSPLLFATWIPYLGKFIEKERFYLSSVLLERCRPYFEVGYGFTNRYISAGFFAGFKNTEFQSAGFRFEFELFRRW